MKFGFAKDSTFRPVCNKTIDLRTAKFSLAAPVRRRSILNCLAYVPLGALCVYVGHPWIGLMVLALGAFVLVWQVVGYGFGMVSPERLAITRFYSKKYLIFVGCFWLILLSVVGILMYRNAAGRATRRDPLWRGVSRLHCP